MPTLDEWEQALSDRDWFGLNHRRAFFRKCGNATRRKMQSVNKADKRYRIGKTTLQLSRLSIRFWMYR